MRQFAVAAILYLAVIGAAVSVQGFQGDSGQCPFDIGDPGMQ